jgi:hypothetical protein
MVVPETEITLLFLLFIPDLTYGLFSTLFGLHDTRVVIKDNFVVICQNRYDGHGQLLLREVESQEVKKPFDILIPGIDHTHHI